MCVVFVFKIFQHHNDNDWFMMYQNVRYDTRSSSLRNLITSFVTTLSSLKSISHAGPMSWNLLPIELKLVQTY